MALKQGDKCYHVVWSGAKITYWEYVLRTIRTSRGRYSWEKPAQYGYWWNKLPGVTWGRLSKKQGHYGWLPDASQIWREKCPIDSGRPYAATKLGALKAEIAALRANIDHYGLDYDLDEEGVKLERQLEIALRAQKRLRNKK